MKDRKTAARERECLEGESREEREDEDEDEKKMRKGGKEAVFIQRGSLYCPH